MDIQIVERLAAAGVCLEGARELVEVGGVEWSMIGSVVDLVEALVGFEVREGWPAEVSAADFAGRRVAANTSLDSELLKRLWAVFDAAKALADGDDQVVAWSGLHKALAAVPESQRP